MDIAMTNLWEVECAACNCRRWGLRQKVLRPQSQVKGKEFQPLCGQGTTRLTVDKLKQYMKNLETHSRHPELWKTLLYMVYSGLFFPVSEVNGKHSARLPPSPSQELSEQIKNEKFFYL